MENVFSSPAGYLDQRFQPENESRHERGRVNNERDANASISNGPPDSGEQWASGNVIEIDLITKAITIIAGGDVVF